MGELVEEAGFLPLLTAAAVAVTLLWFLQLGVRIVWAKRGAGPRSGPSDPAFEQLSPAVVDLITENGVLADEAAAATLIDLAVKRCVDIEEVGPRLSLVRLRRNDLPSLRPQEQLVLDRVTTLARTGVVATKALVESSLDAKEWWETFEKAVIAESRAQDLTRKAGGLGSGMSLIGLLAAGLWALLADFSLMPLLFHAEPELALAPVVFFSLFCLSTVFDHKLSGERLTKQGRRAAGTWLTYRDRDLAGIANLATLPAATVTIWGRPFAYAAAFRLTRTALASLPLTHERDARDAWSDHGGLWHRVRVKYPGQNKVVAFVLLWWIVLSWIAGMLGVSVWYALREQGPDDLDPIVVSLFMLPLGGVFPLVSILPLIPYGRAVHRVWRARAGRALRRGHGDREVIGTVVRIRLMMGGLRPKAETAGSEFVYVAVDDGRAVIRALRTHWSAVQHVTEGDLVRVSATRSGFVARVEPVKEYVQS